ncbi:hypothetical protein DLM46_15180 [Paraburkholderia lacunae]|uniref:Uncharacterized protein n=1 Tax=Paraburkholderia lacunae TaxID=2211104 RepID=A0A370N800_9BURK|nr:hypothetical protein DLM46_15180 [Paraburkholderia lacunae]
MTMGAAVTGTAVIGEVTGVVTTKTAPRGTTTDTNGTNVAFGVPKLPQAHPVRKRDPGGQGCL